MSDSDSTEQVRVELSEQRVRVELSERSYDISIGTGNLASVADNLKPETTHVAVVTDENVSVHANVVASAISQAEKRVDLLAVPAGESSKSVEMANALWLETLNAGTDRKSAIVAVGGGVVGDLAGFIAASFARGIDFYQVPTTLLAQVDSSVGGKVGINLPGAKNMVGAFWQPQHVTIDTSVLSTLPDREYRAGLAEVVKYGVILDEEFFAYLEQNIDGCNQRTDDVLRYVIARCCQLKADVVKADERETTGLRAVLNYGHTFGHALEAVTKYGQFLHGEAISIGMLCASRLAVSLDMIDSSLTERQHQLLEALKLPTAMPDLDHEPILEAMSRDKKVEHGKLRFILPTKIGHVQLVDDVDADLVRASLVSE